MSNIMAAIGLKQLKRFPEMAVKRQALANQYDSLFDNHVQIRPIMHDYETVVPHILGTKIFILHWATRLMSLKNISYIIAP